MKKVSRNDPCPCGSGKKYKQCCQQCEAPAAGSGNHGATPAPTAIAHYNLGNTLLAQGNLDAAISSYRKALALKPDYAEAYVNLGNALYEQGKLGEAVENFRNALTLKPSLAQAHYNMGNALYAQGKLDEAIESFRRTIALRPDVVDAHNNLGFALQAQGKLSEAAESFRRTIVLRPDWVDAHYNFGSSLLNQGRLLEAEASFRRALELKPDFMEAHCNLGITLGRQGRLPEAEDSYRLTLEINPNNALAHANLGTTLMDSGHPAEAEISFRRAMELQPHALEHAIKAHFLLPIIPDTADTITVWREHLQKGIAALMNMSASLEDPADLNSPSFYLAYHNHDNRPIMESLRHLFRARIAGLTFTAPHVLHWQPPTASGKRIRVGFLSEYLVEHTIGHLNQGFIRYLDRNRFEVVVIHSPSAKHDNFRKNLDALADEVFTLPTKLKDQQQAVAAAKLDVLFYPDIGMAPSTYFLAYARLAPVQATSWGHPDTSGLDTMDYFVSATDVEPNDAEKHYTERLICMNRRPCFYQPPETVGQLPPRSAFGLPETGILYGCQQTLFKFHPDFDVVLANIAEGDLSGHIVLIEDKYSVWANLLKARWEKSFPVLLDRVLFLPPMPRDRFIALQALMDVLLDTIHFGGGNTFCEAMIYGTPMVTWPGRFMRSRIVAGGYRQMGVADAPIAQRLEDYAPLALALGRDPERRRVLREASLEAASRELFADMLAVREFEAFLDAAVRAAGCGEKLPTGWRPNIQGASFKK